MEMPRNAVFNNNEVFVLEEGKLQKKEIKILKYNEKTLVFKGLEIGDSLIVQPLINVKAGTRVFVLD